MRFIVTLGAGSGVDIGARLFADKLSQQWGQPVVVENRPGGDGMVAITTHSSAAQDDHVLLVSPVSSFTAHPYFHDKLPYDPKDLIPIARISKTVVAVSVPASLGVNSLKDLEALARAKPGQLNWTTATGFTDFVFAGYLHTVGLKMAKVPYKNPVGAVTDLAAGASRSTCRPTPSCGRRSRPARSRCWPSPITSARRRCPTSRPRSRPAIPRSNSTGWSACSARREFPTPSATRSPPTSRRSPPIPPSWRS